MKLCLGALGDFSQGMTSTENYYSFFSSLIEFAPVSMLSLFLLALFRLAPIIAIAPFLGSKLPSGIKMGFLITLAVLLLPHIAVTSKTLVDFNMTYVGLLFKEFFMGCILAIISAMPFYIAQTSGSLIDFIRGSSALQVTDPFVQAQSSDLGVLYNYIMIVVFYQLDGFFYFFNAILTSYDVIPADGWINPLFFQMKNPFWQIVWTTLSKLFAIAIQLSAPALLAVLMTELFLGIANRLAPQVQIVFLGMSLKSLAGLALLCVAWFFILKQIGVQLLLWLKNFHIVLQTMNA